MHCECSRSTPLAPIQQLHPAQPPTQPVRSIPVPSSPLSQTPIKQLQPTQTLALPQSVSLPPISTFHGTVSEPEPELSSEHEPLSVLPDNIETPVLGFCTNNACIICPVETVGKVGEFYVCFPAKDRVVS